MRAPFGSGWVKLSELPKPHRFFFKGTKRKRDVEVKLFVCPGFTHVYADLDEADDVVWDPRDKQWKRPENDYSNDPELAEVVKGQKITDTRFTGRRYHQRFNHRIDAEKWVLKEAKKNFPPATHRLVNWTFPHDPWKPQHIGKTKEERATKCDKCDLPIFKRGKNQTGDWTGGPYCDVCASHLPPYGDYKAKEAWDKVTPAQAKKWPNLHLIKEKTRGR